MNSKELAKRIRIHAVNMAHYSGESHVASALSMSDIIAVLYADVLRYNVNDVKAGDRDRFILSKGHACSSLYAALAEVGYFSIDILNEQCQNGSILSGHISHKNVPGVEVSTGSLGHGCCMAAGMALNAKLHGKGYRVITLIGDGECDEGSVWEMALFAHHYKLDNMVVIIDHNRMQAMGYCVDVADHVDLANKWRSFGWNVVEIDGHDHDKIREILLKKNDKEIPLCIVANTIKGKGVSFMEENLLWHYRDPQGEAYKNAMKELI